MSNGEGTTTVAERNNIASEVRKLTEEMRAPDWGTPSKTDPTKLTQDAVDRASGQWEQRLLSEIQILVTRLEAMDTATKLNAERIDKMSIDGHTEHDHLQEDNDRHIQALKDLLAERLAAVDEKVRLAARERADQIHAVRELLEARLDGNDEAVKLLAEQLVKFPTDIDRSALTVREFAEAQVGKSLAETSRVRDVMLEKFSKVEAQFVSNDKALTAALAAQEKAAAEQQKSNTLAIDKSEKTTQEQSKANQAQTAAAIESQAGKIDDLKDRVVRLETGGSTRNEERTERHTTDTYSQTEAIARAATQRANMTLIISALIGLVGLVALIISVAHP